MRVIQQLESIGKMASVDKSLDAANIDDNAETGATSSCLNDPNYAIICVFLQKFGGHLKIEHPDFLRLQKMIENTDEGKAIQLQQQQQHPYAIHSVCVCVCVCKRLCECMSVLKSRWL